MLRVAIALTEERVRNFLALDVCCVVAYSHFLNNLLQAMSRLPCALALFAQLLPTMSHDNASESASGLRHAKNELEVPVQ